MDLTDCVCSPARSCNDPTTTKINLEKKGCLFSFLFSFFSFHSVVRRQRQRAFLPVVHLRGHGARRSRDRHVGGSGVGHGPGLRSARDGEEQPQCLSVYILLFFFFFYLSSFLLLLLLQISYVILKDESGDSQFFSIDSRSGVIVTRASFDREQKASYLIEVQSQDGSESARPGQQGQPNTGNRLRPGSSSQGAHEELRLGLIMSLSVPQTRPTSGSSSPTSTTTPRRSPGRRTR